MIYKGEFADSADTKHTVKIYTGWSPTYNEANDTVVPITMGETPVITTMDSGDDILSHLLPSNTNGKVSGSFGFN